MRKQAFLFGLLFYVIFHIKADVKPNSLFSNNMVLQRETVVPVWGTASDGEKISIEFCGQNINTVARNGKWKVELKALKAGGPFTMTIQGKNKVEITNVLVGDVWVCSGQSNMERQLGLRSGQKPIVNWQAESASANFPQIRQFKVDFKTALTPQEDVKSNWVVCNPTSVIDFTAVGFFFAREINQDLSIPIGLLFSSMGGRSIECFTSREAMEQNSETNKIVVGFDRAQMNFPADSLKFIADSAQLIAQWKEDMKLANLNKTAKPRKPSAPVRSSDFGRCGTIYNAMIAPLHSFPVKGVLWYQGEADRNSGKLYQTLFPTMIADWRKKWNNEKMPFLFVQIAPKIDYTPEIREAQMITFKNDPYTSMAVLADCGDSLDSHPALKQPVGHRLALGAKAIAYGQKITFSGPIYKSMKVVESTIEIEFYFVGKGLESKGGDLHDFEIAEADKKYVPAKAIIKGDKVIVSAKGIMNPTAVRMGWLNFPHINLFNKDGLPASSFRTHQE